MGGKFCIKVRKYLSLQSSVLNRCSLTASQSPCCLCQWNDLHPGYIMKKGSALSASMVSTKYMKQMLVLVDSPFQVSDFIQDL